MKAKIKGAILWGKPGEIMEVLTGGGSQRGVVLTRKAEKGITTDWQAVRQACRAGKVLECFHVGEVLTCDHAVFGRLFWQVCWMSKHHLGLVTNRPVYAMEFDAPERAENDEGRKNPGKYCSEYGCNRWDRSAIRRWANSSGRAGEWWEPASDWDLAPSCHGKVAGFMYGLPEDFLECVREKEVVTADPDGGKMVTRDCFYLPSLTEVFGEENCGIAEGEKMILGDDFCRGYVWWLRSPGVGTSYIVPYVSTSGAAAHYGAFGAFGVSLACMVG